MEQVRDVMRERVCANQQQKRDSLLDKNRYIERTESIHKITKEDVVKLAIELKKKPITCEQLSELKEIFLQHKENIKTFLEVDGALEALVKSLSGQNSKLQIKAAYCLCNLSLGDQYLKIIKIAGPYLLVHLEGMNTYLIEACAWTLGNLSSHHKKCTEILKKQGALPVLAHLSNHDDDNIKIAAAYALSHLVFTGYDVLTPDDFRDLIDPAITLFQVKHPSTAYLISIISGNASCQFKLLQEKIHVQSLSRLISSVAEDILNSVWYVRIIANLITETSGQAALHVLNHVESINPEQEIKTLFGVIEYIIRSGQIFLIKECCWLLGNLMNNTNHDVRNIVSESHILDKIADPVRYLLIKPIS